jgi:hypothetical protein
MQRALHNIRRFSGSITFTMINVAAIYLDERVFKTNDILTITSFYITTIYFLITKKAYKGVNVSLMLATLAFAILQFSARSKNLWLSAFFLHIGASIVVLLSVDYLLRLREEDQSKKLVEITRKLAKMERTLKTIKTLPSPPHPNRTGGHTASSS